MNGSAALAILAAVSPLIVFVGYLMVAWIVYVARGRSGVYRDADVARRGASVVLPMRARHFFAWAMRPLWELCHRAGISANMVTAASGVLGLAAGLAVATGRFGIGGWLYLLCGLCDFIDGRLARLSGQQGPRGAAFDSVVDRYSDSAVLIGLGWYYRESWVLLAVMAALLGSLLVSYVRARGEGLGTSVSVGFMQRPERILILGLSLALSPVVETLAVAGVVVMALGTQATALYRFVYLMRKLPAQPPRPRPQPSLVDRGGMPVRFGNKRFVTHIGGARRAEK